MYVEEIVAQRAVEQTGFGKFNLKIGATGALVYLNCAFCITSVGFIIPTAACDFEMTTIEKGRLNAAPMLGMVVGSTMWGYLADLKGRRFTLLTALFLQLSVDVLASVIPHYSVFVILKLFSGIGFTGQLSAIFPYVGEFQPTKYRHQILSWMEFFWAIGIISVSLLAWLIIPMKFRLETESFFFGSWNLFVLMSNIPALFTGLWLIQLPETPKYLAESGKRDQLMKVLTCMYVENTGKTEKQFREALLMSACPSLSQLVNESDAMEECTGKNGDAIAAQKKEKLKALLSNSKSQAKTLLRRPYAKRLCITSTIMFCMTSTYYSLMTWFPELFQRFASFESAYPGESASVCSISDKMITINESSRFQTDPDPYGCNSEIDLSVFVNSIWLGAACIPCAILLPLTVDKLGYRVYLVFTATISTAVTIAFFFVKTSTQNLVLSCIFEAFTSLSISIIFCLLVELFPTNLRVMATAITLFVARFGSLFGNTLFGYLIDNYCSTLIIVMAAQLAFAACLCWFTPSRDKLKKIQDHPSTSCFDNKAFGS